MADAAPEEVEPNEDDAAAGNEGYSSESIKEEHDEANKLDAGAWGLPIETIVETTRPIA